ncbi:MAG: hypothetical protein ABGX83_05470 [Nitrospira sp.]
MKKIFIAMVLIFGLVGIVEAQVTGKATLSWDANIETDLSGYRVYQSSVPGELVAGGVVPVTLFSIATMASSVVGVPSAQVGGLSDNVTYFFAVTAFDTSGNESPLSTVVSKTISIPPGAPKNFQVVIELVFPIIP